MKKLQNLKGIGLYCGNDQDIIINKNNFLYFTSVENLLTSLQKANKYDFIVIDKTLQSVDNFHEYITSAMSSLKPGGTFIFIVPDFIFSAADFGFLRTYLNVSYVIFTYS